LYGLLWCEGDSDFPENSNTPFFIAYLFNTPVDRFNFFDAEIQVGTAWELFDTASFPLPNGLSFNSTMGRFEATADAIFSDNPTSLEWNGPIFLQREDGLSGIYDVDLNVETFNCE